MNADDIVNGMRVEALSGFAWRLARVIGLPDKRRWGWEVKVLIDGEPTPRRLQVSDASCTLVV